MQSLDNIKNHLDEVFNEVEKVLGFKPKCYLAGGCIASLILGEEVKDYDMFFETMDDFILVKDSDYVYLNTAANTKYALTINLPSKKVVQFISHRVGKAEELVPKFDFVHTQSYYKQDGTLVCDVNQIKEKTLILTGELENIIFTLKRMAKFSQRGYFVPIETIKTFFSKLDKIDKNKVREIIGSDGDSL